MAWTRPGAWSLGQERVRSVVPVPQGVPSRMPWEGGGRRGVWRGPESRLQTLLRGQAGDEPGSGGGSGEGGRCI